jgi:hypothetical protein
MATCRIVKAPNDIPRIIEASRFADCWNAERRFDLNYSKDS